MNRTERRRVEKQLGLMKTYMTANSDVKSGIQERRKEMGKRFHEQHIENQENNRIKISEMREVKSLQNLMNAGYSEHEAKSILESNRTVDDVMTQKRSKIK